MPFKELYKNIFGKDEPSTGDTTLLEQRVKEYPYFSLAHFYLLKHTFIKDADYPAIASKTALHFNHPFYLHDQLHKDLPPEAIQEEEIAAYVQEQEEKESEKENILPEAAEQADVQTVEIVESVLPNEETAFLVSPLELENDNPVIVKEVADETKEELDTELPSGTVQSPEVDNEINNKRDDVEAGRAQFIELSQKSDRNKVGTLAEDTKLEEGISQKQKPAPVNDAQGIKIAPVAKTGEAPVIGMADSNSNDQMPLFEPLFATDYFASQGIKLRDEVLPNDKLGKQLRSFTDWLKTMKKVHESKLPSGSEAIDLSVQTLAEKSNKEEDIITETMAEVYLQQGKAKKAKEIYQKLSLLNPSKSAYFAAKIEQIQ